MKSITRTALSAGALVAGIGFVLRFLTPVIYGHGSEARYVQEVAWEKPHVARTYGLSYSELGIGASRGRIELRTLQGRTCVSGSVIGFDIDDQYAFDIDEQV